MNEVFLSIDVDVNERPALDLIREGVCILDKRGGRCTDSE